MLHILRSAALQHLKDHPDEPVSITQLSRLSHPHKVLPGVVRTAIAPLITGGLVKCVDDHPSGILHYQFISKQTPATPQPERHKS